MTFVPRDNDRINIEKAQAEWDASHPEPSPSDKLYEALKRAVKEENRTWEMMCRVNKQCEMRTPERLAWVVQAEKAMASYEKRFTSQQDVPPGIIAFKDIDDNICELAHSEINYIGKEADYSEWVKMMLEKRGTFHIISVNNILWSVGEEAVYGGKIEAFEWTGSE